MDKKDCYLTANMGTLSLICERADCRQGPYFWSLAFLNGTLPEEIVIARAKHLATHVEESSEQQAS